jgi:hypothetical protein
MRNTRKLKYLPKYGLSSSIALSPATGRTHPKHLNMGNV